jgi:hypothetical protein
MAQEQRSQTPASNRMSVVERIEEIERTLTPQTSAMAQEQSSKTPRPASKATKQNEKLEENEPEKIGTFEELLALDPTQVAAIRVVPGPWAKVCSPPPSKNRKETK